MHQSLPSNRKTLRLKALLRSRTSQTVGWLCLLWLWAVDNTKDGDISGISPKELAEVADFNVKRADEFLDALIASGFVDRDGDRLRFHDWEDYAGKLQEQRKKATERKRKSREKTRDVTRDGTVTSRDAAHIHNSTLHNTTVHNSTVQTYSDDVGEARAEASESLREYLGSRGLLPEEYLGAEAKLLEESERLCTELFSRFASRGITELDRAKVFSCVREQLVTPQGIESRISPQKRELLFYAFEQAAAKGCGGQWAYIEGVLARLGQRGITDLRGAEYYDMDRPPGL